MLKFFATNDCYRGTKRPFVARVTGVGGKYGVELEFLGNPFVAVEPKGTCGRLVHCRRNSTTPASWSNRG